MPSITVNGITHTSPRLPLKVMWRHDELFARVRNTEPGMEGTARAVAGYCCIVALVFPDLGFTYQKGVDDVDEVGLDIAEQLGAAGITITHLSKVVTDLMDEVYTFMGSPPLVTKADVEAAVPTSEGQVEAGTSA